MVLGAHAVLLATLGVGAPTAGDTAESVEIQVEGETSCASEAEVRARLRHYLSASDSERPGVLARIEVHATEPAVEATLEVTIPGGHSARELKAGTCEELTDAVALVVAMAVDPLLNIVDLAPADPAEATDAAEEPEPEPVEEEPAQPDIVTPKPPEPANAAAPGDTPAPSTSSAAPSKPAEPRDRPRSLLRGLKGEGWVAGGISGGLLPRVGGLIEAGGGIRWRWLRVRALGTYRFAREEPIANTDGSIVLAAWGVGAHGCYVAGFGRLEVAGCGVVEAGQVRGAGQDLPRDETNARPWLGLGLRAALSARITRWLLVSLEAQALAHVGRPLFVVQGVSGEFGSDVIGGRGVAGFAIRLP